MKRLDIPVSSDIYIEADGRRLAIVESYKAQALRELYAIEELGSPLPVQTVSGKVRYRLELKRVVFSGSVDFHALSGFSVVIVKPGSRTVFSGCEWEQISEGVSLGEPCVETVTLTAGKRVVLSNS